MTKLKTHTLQKPIKKKHTKEDIEKLLPPEESSQLEQPKKRLRKHRKHDSGDQGFVPDASDSDELDNQKYDPQDVQLQEFSRFKIQNDDDIQEQKEKLEQKKRSKKLKNNQQIDKVIKKMQANQAKQKKQVTKKKQQVQVQSNIHDFFKRKRQQKKKAQKQPTPHVSEDSGVDESISEGELLMKTMQAKDNIYSKFQGNVGNASEKQLMERAFKLSLQSANKQHTKIEEEKHVDINKFQFENLHPHHNKEIKPKSPHKDAKKSIHHQVHQKMQIQKPKQKHDVKKHQSRSATKKISTKKSKQPNEGPLGDETIVFTGEFQPYNKDQLIELCQKLGATIPKSFTKGVTVLFQGLYVVNEWKKKTNQDIKTTGKSQQAQKRGTRVVANNDLDDYFLQKTGKTLEEYFRKNPQKLDGFVEKEGPAKENEKMEIEIVDSNFANKRKNSANFGVLWTEKYKPNTLDEVIGQGSQIKQLRQWLQDWEEVVLKGNKKDVIPVRGFLQAGTINSKAALLSGDPGLGKTTTARLLAKELRYNVVQFNASDIRNKKGVQLLERNSSGLNKSQLVKNLVIMDQVDGMSKGDRGGITEIIHMIKSTAVPIICICNDRQSQKIRSLAGHCFDIRFHKPHKQLIVKRLKQIIDKEGGQASDLYLSRLVQTFQNDMRQILNYLELAFNTKAAQVLQIKDINKLSTFTKDNAVMLTNFDATKKLLNRQDDMPLRQRMECYFIDSDFVPIMVHENYLSSMKKGRLTKNEFHKLVKANEGFVLSDLIDTKIRKEQDWSLMPAAGYMSSVYPSLMVSESIGFPQFPSWLGKFSSERKHKRLLKELKQTIHCEYPSTFKGVRYGLAEVLYQQFNHLLKLDKVDETLNLMETYGLTPVSLNEVLLQVQYNPQKSILLPDVSASTKTKLTKAFNKRHQQMKMKGKIKKEAAVAQPEHHKYNEVLDEMSEDDFTDVDGDETNNEESNMIGENKNKNKKKASKAGTKKK